MKLDNRQLLLASMLLLLTAFSAKSSYAKPLFSSSSPYALKGLPYDHFPASASPASKEATHTKTPASPQPTLKEAPSGTLPYCPSVPEIQTVVFDTSERANIYNKKYMINKLHSVSFGGACWSIMLDGKIKAPSGATAILQVQSFLASITGPTTFHPISLKINRFNLPACEYPISGQSHSILAVHLVS